MKSDVGEELYYVSLRLKDLISETTDAQRSLAAFSSTAHGYHVWLK